MLLSIIIPLPAQSQVTHLDSVLVKSLEVLRPSISSFPFAWSGDSSLQPLLRMAQQAPGQSVPIFYVSSLSATVQTMDSAKARMSIDLGGALLRPGDPMARTQSISRVFDIFLTQRDRILLETNQDRYVSLEQPTPKSLWSRTLEPALVVIGAAVIVALFFLIRS